MGRAAVARAQLELSLDIIVALLGLEPNRQHASHPREPFEAKVAFLKDISRSRLLKHQWWSELKALASETESLNDLYSAAAMGSVYSRGAGYLEEILRPLAAKLAVTPPALHMTPTRIQLLAAEIRNLAVRGAALAAALVDAAQKLAIIGDAD